MSDLATKNTVREWAEEVALNHDCEFMLADGFEVALVGIGSRAGDHQPFAIYDRAACIQSLMDGGEMTRDEAEEYFSFNVESAFVGDGTPCFFEALPE